MTSSVFKAAAFAQETAEVPLVLLTITHADLPAPIRVVNNHTDIVSNGNTFQAFPFEIDLPDVGAGAPPRVTLRIDNVDRQIVDSLRAISSPFELQIDVAVASQPNTIEASFSGLKAIRAVYDALTVEAELGFEDVLNEPYPGDSFTPARNPGLF